MSTEVKAVVDVHEPDHVSNAVLFHPDIDGVAVDQPLDAADIIINGVGFERKTPSDYANSLTGGRLKGQVRKLADAFDHAYVLVEGDIGDFATLTRGPGETSLRGSVASNAARHGVNTYFCGDTDTLVDMAIRLGRKHTEAPIGVYVPTVDIDDAPTALKMYAQIPDIGPTLAETLYDAYPAIPDIIDATIDELTALDGVGEKTAETVLTAFRGRV